MKMRSNFRRYATMFVAAIVVVLTLAILGRASQTLTVPNSATFAYNLAPGANSAPITPPSNQSVFMMGTQTTVGYRGVAHATLLHVPATLIEWVGLESTTGSVITQGYSATAGIHILYLDFSHQVDVQVASADTIWIHNGSGANRTGDLKLIW